jgi:hypothetical protein
MVTHAFVKGGGFRMRLAIPAGIEPATLRVEI